MNLFRRQHIIFKGNPQYSMTWWKWSLAAIWYGILSIGIAASFTLMGEKEPGAGYYFLAVTLVAMAILGVCLWFLL